MSIKRITPQSRLQPIRVVASATARIGSVL